jgi:Retrotransposon gag protein
MHRRLRSQQPPLLFTPEPERVYLGRRRRVRMGDHQEELTMEELRRQIDALTIRNREVEATNQAEVRAREAAEAEAERLRTLGPQNAQQYMHPTLRMPESAIVIPPLGRGGFEIKPHFITLIKSVIFEGRPTEDPIAHVKVFLDLCETITTEGLPVDYVKLKAFKWSLGGKALAWLDSLPPRSITTWTQLYELFMNKFFPPAKTTELRGQITSYRQRPGESFVETWERFKDMQAKCPTHGQPPYVLQQILFSGLDAHTRARINLHTSCGFLDMDPADAFALIDKLTTYDAMYEAPMMHSNVGGRGLYEVSKEVDKEVRAQFQQDEANKLKRQLQNFKACQLCHLTTHTAENCPNLKQYIAGVSANEEEVNFGSEDYRPRGPALRPYVPPNRNPYYNQGGQNTEPYLKDVLRDINMQLVGVGKSIKGMNAHLNDIDYKLGEMDTWRRGVDKRLGDLAQEIPRPQGQLPGHPDENPRGKIAAISLRSGKEVPGRRIEEEKTSVSSQPEAVSARYPVESSRNQPLSPIIEREPEISARYGLDKNQQRPTEEDIERPVPLSTRNPLDSTAQNEKSAPKVIPSGEKRLPFPRKKKDDTEAKYEKFIKVLKSLNITIPFSDALSEMPAYSKFLKDILAKKRLVPDTILGVNSLSLPSTYKSLNKGLPEKLCDPGRFAITIGLGHHKYLALIDLGASASLMPLSIWKEIQLGDLRPVNMKLFMADGSCTHSTGILDDVPVQVGKFFVPNDFVVMDIEEDESVPIILGRPFLATAGAVIDMRELLMTLDICGEQVVYDFKDSIAGTNPVDMEKRPDLRLPYSRNPEVKRVDVEESRVEENVYEEAFEVEASEEPSEEEVEQISSALDDLHVEESFVWKHGVLDSWHLVGRKVPNVDDAKGKGKGSGSKSCGDERVEFVGSFEGGSRRSVKMKPPKFRGEIRRGKTLFDWEAFGLEMLGRRKVDYPP